jgi:hypothetical protein
MVPSAFAFGDGGEFRSPMAIAVIGGLLVSTVLSLVFVPAVFTFLDDLGRIVSRLLGRFVGPKDEPEEGEVAHPPQPLNDAAEAWRAHGRRTLPQAAE